MHEQISWINLNFFQAAFGQFESHSSHVSPLFQKRKVATTTARKPSPSQPTSQTSRQPAKPAYTVLKVTGDETFLASFNYFSVKAHKSSDDAEARLPCARGFLSSPPDINICLFVRCLLFVWSGVLALSVITIKTLFIIPWRCQKMVKICRRIGVENCWHRGGGCPKSGKKCRLLLCIIPYCVLSEKIDCQDRANVAFVYEKTKGGKKNIWWALFAAFVPDLWLVKLDNWCRYSPVGSYQLFKCYCIPRKMYVSSFCLYKMSLQNNSTRIPMNLNSNEWKTRSSWDEILDEIEFFHREKKRKLDRSGGVLRQVAARKLGVGNSTAAASTHSAAGSLQRLR